MVNLSVDLSFCTYFFYASDTFLFLFSQANGTQCPTCSKMIFGDLTVHKYKCFFCTKCQKFATQEKRHVRVCKGPGPPEAKKEKCPVPDCDEMLHPLSRIRHIKRKHPDVDVDFYRLKAAHSSSQEEKMANIAKMRAVKQVLSNIFHNISNP